MKGLKAQGFLCLSLLILCLSGVSALGTLHADLITPLTQDYVSIPSLAADLLVATTTTATNLRGEFPEGFNINAVGGISFHSLGDHSVNVPGDISYSAPVSGDVSLFGKNVELHATQNVNIWSATQGILSVQNDLNLYTVTGDFKIQSYLNTDVDAINGIAIGSLHRETQISAPIGILEINTDIVSFTSGDIDEYGSPAFFLLSNDTIDIRATKTFLIDSNTLNITAFQDLTIQSDVHNVEFEARQTLSVTATSNVILKSVSNTYFESLLDDFVASSNGVVSFYAHGSFFYAASIFLDSDNDVRFDSAGHIKFSEATGTQIDASEIDLESQYVKWTATTGNIDINVDVLDIFSDNVFFTTSHVPGSKVNVLSTGEVSFVTYDSDIRFNAFYSAIRAGTNIDISADSDIFLIGVRHSNQANLLSPDGFSTYDADKFLTIGGVEVYLQANGGIVINDDATVSLTAGSNFNIVSWNYFLQSSSNQITYSSPDATFSALDTTFSSEAISITAGDVASYADRKFFAIANSDKLAPIKSTSVGLSLTSSESGLDTAAQTITVSGSSINFSNNFQDNQEFNVDAANSLTMTTAGNLSYNGGTGINLLAPTGNIQAFAGRNANFAGNGGIFKSITGDMTIDATVTGSGTNINLRAGELISWNGKGQTFTVSATNTLSFDSGVSIGLVSKTLVLSAPSGDVNFYADYSSYVLGQGNITINSKNIHAQGGDVVLESQDQANFFVNGTSTISSNNLHNIILDIEQNFFTRALGNIYETAPYFYGSFDDDMTVTTSAISYTSSLDNDISFTSLQSTYTIDATGNINFLVDSLNSTSPAGSLNIFSSQLSTYSAYYGTITAGNSIYFQTNKDLSIVSQDMSIYLDSFQFDQSDFTIGGNSNTKACTGDYRIKSGGTYDYHSVGTIPVYQQINPCNSTCTATLCTPDHFDIVSRSNRTQSMITNQVTYDSNHAININGGDLLFRTTNAASSINMTTTNGVTFASQNFPNHLAYNPDDNLYAGNNLNITINGAAHFEADGYDDNSAYPNYGILMETSINPLYSFNTNYTIKVPNGEINEFAYKLLRIATLQPLDNTAATLSPQTPATFLGQRQDFTVAVTRDVLFDGGVGSITAISGGNLLTDDDDAVASDSGMTFLAAVGDIAATADKAKMIFKDKYLFSVLSQTEDVLFTSTLDQSHSSERKDGNMLYHSEFGLMNFNDKLDTSIIAGSVTEDASIVASASNQILITSGQNQVYHATGANTDATGVAINIIGDEGDIIAQTPSAIEFDSAARVEISAQTGVLTFTMNKDIAFYADGRIDYVSQYTSNFTVLQGDLDFNANGGGGSVSINSDDGQDITGVAGQAIKVNADANNNIYAINGINVLSQTGDISLSNEGVDNDMFFLSQGSVLIKAQDTTGVAIYGYSYHIDAFQDVTFDAALFTVDSTSAQTTATEPVIEIHAGGDVSDPGVLINSNGQVLWTTKEAAGVHIQGDKVKINAGVDIIMNTNGPILFENKGVEDAALFSITATSGSFTMDAYEDAVVAGISLANFNTAGFILLQTTSNDAGDGITIRTERDLEIDTATFNLLTSSLEGEVRRWDVTAANLISINNTVGDGGSLKFNSDLSLDLTSVGPILITASGETSIVTVGEDADINFSAAGSVTLNSGESTFFQSNTFVGHSTSGLVFNSTGGLMQFTASNDATFAANGTFSLTSRSNLDITTNDISSVLRITSTGDESFTSSNDLSIDSTNGRLYAVADSELIIDNRIPTRPRDQGDIYVTSYGDLFFGAGGDVTQIANTGVYSATVDGSSRITSFGDVTLSATNAGASIDLLAQDGAFDIYAGDQLLFGVGLTTGQPNPSASLIVQSTQNVTWVQNYEEGFGGISVSSFRGVLSVNSGNTASYTAEGSVTIEANDYVSFFSVDAMTIRNTVYDEADTIFQTTNADVIIHAGTTFTYASSFDEARVVIQGLADQTPSDSLNSVYIESTADAITFNTKFVGNFVSTSGGNTIFQTADLPTLDIVATSTGAINIVATGIDPTGSYGVYMETDDTIQFTSTNSRNLINIESSYAVFNGSEDFHVLSSSRNDFIAGDDFFIFTGFTPEPNADLAGREGISITSSTDILYSSIYNDVIIRSEDASWSVSSNLFMRSSSVGGSVVFSSTHRPISMPISNNANFYPTELQAFGDSINLISNGATILLSAKKDLFIYGSTIDFATSGSSITVGSNSGDIRFYTPHGHVSAVQRPFLIPQLQYQAGMSQILGNYFDDPFLRPFLNGHLSSSFPHYQDYVAVENQYPGCQERAFGFDEISQTMCYCDFNKWRCVVTLGFYYQQYLDQYYNLGVLAAMSSPDF